MTSTIPLDPEIRTEFRDYAADGAVFESFLAYEGAASGPRPCILLAHPWAGQNAAIRVIARRIAALGYFVFALDVYGKGIRGDELGDNRHLMGPLMNDRRRLGRRLRLALDTARADPRVDPESVAIVGHCFGGLCALDLARSAPPGLKAAVSLHGDLTPPRIGRLAPIDASILILHGWEDPVAPPRDVLALAQELTDAEADWQLHAYGHAMHAFTFVAADDPDHGIRYDEAADRRSWAAMCGFLEERLIRRAPRDGA